MANGWLVFLGLLAAYLLILVVLAKSGAMRRSNMSLFLGVFLMLKTGKGQGLLNWFARARGLFDRTAQAGLYLTGLVMAFMTLLLVWQLFFIFQLPADQAPDPIYVLGIPGINPIIPVGFGIIALIVAVVVHEFSHGILARVYDLKVKTMGILLFIVPVGAFVEPDEDQLRAAPRGRRLKVFGAGPISNLILAVVFAVLFSSVLMSGARPVAGVPIEAIEEDSPAAEAGLEPGWVITHVEGQGILCPQDFREIMGNTTVDIRPNTTITLRLDPRDGGAPQERDVTTARRADLYAGEEYQPFYDENPEVANDTVIGVQIFPTCELATAMKAPFTSGGHLLFYTLLPFQALEGRFPLTAPDNAFFETPFEPSVFWFLANLVYWLFWINLMIGLTNALPLMPLDGGHMFRDFVDGFLAKVRPAMAPDARGATANRIAAAVGFSVLLLILAQFIGPGLAAAFA